MPLFLAFNIIYLANCFSSCLLQVPTKGWLFRFNLHHQYYAHRYQHLNIIYNRIVLVHFNPWRIIKHYTEQQQLVINYSAVVQ